MKRNRPHPVTLIVCLLGISALFAGCETFAHRKPAINERRVEVIRTNNKPPGNIQELGVVSEEGTGDAQGEIEKQFLKTARQKGADALIFEPVVKIGEDVGLFASADTFLYKATMVSYGK